MGTALKLTLTKIKTLLSDLYKIKVLNFAENFLVSILRGSKSKSSSLRNHTPEAF
jgi:hypothetical protein